MLLIRAGYYIFPGQVDRVECIFLIAVHEREKALFLHVRDPNQTDIDFEVVRGEQNSISSIQQHSIDCRYSVSTIIWNARALRYFRCVVKSRLISVHGEKYRSY